MNSLNTPGFYCCACLWRCTRVARYDASTTDLGQTRVQDAHAYIMDGAPPPASGRYDVVLHDVFVGKNPWLFLSVEFFTAVGQRAGFTINITAEEDIPPLVREAARQYAVANSSWDECIYYAGLGYVAPSLSHTHHHRATQKAHTTTTALPS